ncbi:MAG: hypothetical protein VX125_18035 [Pseudomonadota bacterium]|uniref:Uncharacterized protein n=1 Tax=Acinetobacter bereziniae TaxID=106648 RepID=A0A8I1DJ67_ACIBZ|nr:MULTISPECIES: hypothetical protein [Acinetobacter]MBJ9950860.1 hypothetical protein [Acinetobacter bereziniae]MEC8125713.1 hypothetical protein [Pseudomonadota bacterium]QQC84180.1 hypothetical protein I9190_18375 [Acinetobacter bereziniae]UUN97366.1 hypothetical protein I9054_018840 [Acinetobacter bereziniae]
MKFKLFLTMMTLSISCFSYAETQSTSVQANTSLKPLSGVRVSMQRMLKSGEGRYYMNLYAGIAHPHGVLTDLMNGTTIDFKGTQKGDQLDLKSLASEADNTTVGKYQLTGVLNANSGLFKATLLEAGKTARQSIQFEPAFKVVNKPVFIFKFYGQDDANSPFGKTLKRVDVLNKNNNTVVQSLTGFTGYPNSVGYMDINFDGYYDVIVSDLSQGRTVEDKRYIYWMYNPKTQQFQRSPQLEKIAGFPNLHGEKQQIDFGNRQVYQVENGLLIRVKGDQ